MARTAWRRPAVSAAALFIGGIATHAFWPHGAIIWALAALGFAALAIAFFHQEAMSTTSAALAIFAGGVAAAQLHAFYFRPNDISTFSTDEPRLARIELRLDNPLRLIGAGAARGRSIPPRQVTTASVLRVMTKAGWASASGEVLLQIDPPNEKLALGQTVRVLGMLQRPGEAMNPGQFDWAAYYREQRICASLQLHHGGALEIVASRKPSLLARLRQGVRDALAKGFSEEQSLDHALLAALVLGDKDPELRDVQEQFRRTGTSHHLAISGMHIAVLGALVYAVGRRMALRPRWLTLITLAMVVLYGLVALPSPPVARSVLLCFVVGLGLMMFRPTDMVQMLALSVLLMLVWHPLDLFNAGFQLSFGTVLGLMVLTRRIEAIFHDRDAEIATTTPGGQPPKRLIIAQRVRKFLAPPLAAGITAWLVSMPLIAFHFDQLNPWAVPASLLLAVPVFMALVGGFLKIVLTGLLPFAAPLWAQLAGIPVAWMRHGVDWLAQLPGSDVPLPAHSISFVAVYYALLLLPLAPIAWPRVKRTMRLAPAIAVMLLVMIPLSGGAARPHEALRVTTLAVGAGQCCVIELPDGRVILLDAGSRTTLDPARRCIMPYLRNGGHSSVDEIWLSDGDYDHIVAAEELMRAFGVGRVAMSAHFERDAEGKPANETLLETIRRRRVQVTRLGRGDHLLLGGGASVDVLWPPANAVAGTSNNRDLVLKLNYARRTILFPADIQQPAMLELLRKPNELRCDAMLAPHHGSAEPATADFIAAADPLYIVSSNDRTLSQKQRLFERQTGGRALYRTNKCGATTLTIDRTGGLTVSSFIDNEAGENTATPQPTPSAAGRR